MFAVIDRYVVLRWPFDYPGTVIARLILSATLFFAISQRALGSYFAPHQSFCIDTIAGPGNNARPFSTAGIYNMVLTLIPPVVSLVGSILVLFELLKMRKRSLNAQQREISEAAKYIIIINTLLLLNLMPMYLSMLLGHSASPVAATSLIYVSVFSFSIYGIFNIIIYGLRYKSYRDTLRGLFRSQVAVAVVDPAQWLIKLPLCTTSSYNTPYRVCIFVSIMLLVVYKTTGALFKMCCDVVFVWWWAVTFVPVKSHNMLTRNNGYVKLNAQEWMHATPQTIQCFWDQTFLDTWYRIWNQNVNDSTISTSLFHLALHIV